MKQALCTFTAMLVLASVAAAQRVVPLDIAITAANVTFTNTVSQSAQGAVDAVYVQIPASQTAEVTVVANPAFGSGLPGVILYTNAALTVSAVARPRYVPTDNTGSTNALVGASHGSVPYFAAGDTVTLRVLQASAGTNITYRAFLKLR